MKRLWGALGLVLALIVIMPGVSTAQTSGTGTAKKDFTLGQNYPNPYNPETTIPFTLGDFPTCSNPGKTYRVSLKIYNMLYQIVAIPALQRSGPKLLNQTLTCGNYTAWWDGKVLGTNREAASGVYIYRIEVDGVSAVGKMINLK